MRKRRAKDESETRRGGPDVLRTSERPARANRLVSDPTCLQLAARIERERGALRTAHLSRSARAWRHEGGARRRPGRPAARRRHGQAGTHVVRRNTHLATDTVERAPHRSGALPHDLPPRRPGDRPCRPRPHSRRGAAPVLHPLRRSLGADRGRTGPDAGLAHGDLARRRRAVPERRPRPLARQLQPRDQHRHHHPAAVCGSGSRADRTSTRTSSGTGVG